MTFFSALIENTVKEKFAARPTPHGYVLLRTSR